MENKSSVIASSNNPVPVLGQFLEQSGAKEAATNFAKNFVKSKFNKKKVIIKQKTIKMLVS